jgi:5-methylcytosine-specific restriction protein B
MRLTTPDAHSLERLERIWRSSILPLLQEHHYGEWDSVRRRYQLSSLLAAIGAGPAEVADAETGAAEEPASESPEDE